MTVEGRDLAILPRVWSILGGTTKNEPHKTPLLSPPRIRRMMWSKVECLFLAWGKRTDTARPWMPSSSAKGRPILRSLFFLLTMPAVFSFGLCSLSFLLTARLFVESHKHIKYRVRNILTFVLECVFLSRGVALLRLGRKEAEKAPGRTRPCRHSYVRGICALWLFVRVDEWVYSRTLSMISLVLAAEKLEARAARRLASISLPRLCAHGLRPRAW